MCRNWSDDRDRSILALIGMTAGEAEHGAGMAEEKQQVDEFAYDGRFDDPLTEHASVAFVGGGVRDHGSAKPEASIPSTGKRPERYPDRILVSVKRPPDTDDSDESFYSCPGTPKNSLGEDVEAQSAYIPPNPTDSGGTALTFHRPHHISYSAPSPESIQLTSYLYASHKGKEPAPSVLSSALETIPQHKFQFSQFPHTRQRRDFEEQIQSTLGSAESSFNASSSFSNKPGMDWSPPTSLETSFNEDLGPITRPTRPNCPRLDIVAEGIDETRFSGDEEAPYNGDSDGDTTDIDDSRVGYRHKQPRPLANRASQSLRNLPLSRNQQRKASATPNPNNTMEEEEEEVALQKMAKEFFDDEYEPPYNPGTPSFGSLGRDHEIHLMNEQAAGSGSGAGEWENINYALELVKEVQGPWDDDNEFGEVGTSFGEAFSGECFLVIAPFILSGFLCLPLSNIPEINYIRGP